MVVVSTGTDTRAKILDTQDSSYQKCHVSYEHGTQKPLKVNVKKLET